MKEQLKDIERQARWYYETVLSFYILERQKYNFEPWEYREEMEQRDRNRRRAHDSFISKIDILSRMFAKAGVQTDWRKEIGRGREEIGEWTLSMVHLKEREAEHD